jgi:hypothetical protein
VDQDDPEFRETRGTFLRHQIEDPDTHVRAIYRKLQVHSVAEAVRKAVQAGLW